MNDGGWFSMNALRMIVMNRILISAYAD